MHKIFDLRIELVNICSLLQYQESAWITISPIFHTGSSVNKLIEIE